MTVCPKHWRAYRDKPLAERLQLQLQVPEKLQLYRAAQQNEGAGDAGLQLEPQEEEWTCAVCHVPPAEGVWVGCSTCNATWVCAPCAGMAGATLEAIETAAPWICRDCERRKKRKKQSAP